LLGPQDGFHGAARAESLFNFFHVAERVKLIKVEVVGLE